MQAVLLAGGLGTRLRPLTKRRPKLALPMLNQPLITYELRQLATYGITHVTLTTSYMHESLAAAVDRHWPFARLVEIVVEDTPLGTAGAIKNVEDRLGPVFIAANADYVRDIDWAALLQVHQESRAALTLTLYEVDDPRQYGLVLTHENGLVRQFLEKTEDPPPGERAINAGAYAMNREVLARVPPGTMYSNEYDLFPQLLAEGVRVQSYLHRGYWLDVGRVEQYLQAHYDLLDGTARGLRPAEARVIEESQGPLAAPVCCGDGCEIAPDAQVGPYACLGERCAVGAGAEVSRSVLWDDVVVGEGAVVRSSVVCSGVAIPPHSEVIGQVIPEPALAKGDTGSDGAEA
jgi:mannose-1-phosphate guanylyltransferase/phosphomannomutase